MDWPGLVDKWNPGEPNNLNKTEDVMDINENGGHNDIAANDGRESFVCKIPCILYFMN